MTASSRRRRGRWREERLRRCGVSGYPCPPLCAEARYRKWWLKTTETHPLTGTKDRCLNSRCQQGCVLPGALKSNLSRAPLSAQSAILGVPQCVDASLPLLSLDRPCPSTGLCARPVKTPAIWDKGSTLLQHDAGLTHSFVTSAKTLFPDQVTRTGTGGWDRCQGLGLSTYLLGEHNSTHSTCVSQGEGLRC